MTASTTCPKCESQRIIPNAEVRAIAEGGGKIYIPVSEHPDALIFKGTHLGYLRAWICGNCGFTELYMENSEELYAAYEASRQS